MSFVTGLPEPALLCSSDKCLSITELSSLDAGRTVINLPNIDGCASEVTEIAEIAEEAAEDRVPVTASKADRSNSEVACCCSCHSLPGLAENSSRSSSDASFLNETLSPLFLECGMTLAVASDSACTNDVASALSPVKSITSEKICRICLDAVESEELIAPCKCSGSTKYAHETCLLQWFFKSKKKSCELCLGKVNVKPVGFKPVQEWRLPEKKCDFIVYLFGLYFLIMLIFTGMITWIATQGCTSPVCVTLYAVCGVALIYFIYCCGCVEYSRSYWKALVSVNRVWRIYGREENFKNIDAAAVAAIPTVTGVAPFPGNLSLRFPTPTGISSVADCPRDRYAFRDMNERRRSVVCNSSSTTLQSDTTVTGTDNLAVEYDDADHEIALHLSESTSGPFVVPYSRNLRDSTSVHVYPAIEQSCRVELICGSAPFYNSLRGPYLPTDFDVVSVTEVCSAVDDITNVQKLSTNVYSYKDGDSPKQVEGTQVSSECCQHGFGLTKL